MRQRCASGSPRNHTPNVGEKLPGSTDVLTGRRLTPWIQLTEDGCLDSPAWIGVKISGNHRSLPQQMVDPESRFSDHSSHSAMLTETRFDVHRGQRLPIRLCEPARVGYVADGAKDGY